MASNSGPSPSNCAQMIHGDPSSEPSVASTSAPAPPPAQAKDKGSLPADYEYDFVKEPPKDFFCAVSLELLMDPQQSDCCGHHFTREVTERIKASGKPCPMCKADKLVAHSDKYHKRRVSEVSVRCLHKEKGNCEWVGELGNLSDHALNCPKQPWGCPHCKFAGLKEAESGHLGICKQFPIPCPNRCEVGVVPRCLLVWHKSECLLQEVSCEFANLGCTKRLPRKDLQRHMREAEQEHLRKMCALNLSLTQRLTQKIEERDAEIAQLKVQLRGMEEQLQQSVEKVRESASRGMLEIERRLESEVGGIKQSVASSLSEVNSSISSVKSSVFNVQHQVNAISSPVPPIDFVVTNFAALKHYKQEWCSPPFYTYHGGYKMCIGVSPNGSHTGSGTHVSVRFYKMQDLNSDSLTWGIRIRLTIHVQNQNTKVWEREYMDENIRSKPEGNCVGSSAYYHYLRHSELNSYVKNDRLCIRVSDFKVLQ